MELAGIEPDRGRLAQAWTPEKVMQSIRNEKAAGGPLNIVHVRVRGLVDAATKRYGAWDAALRAAGVDPSEVRLRRAPGGRRLP